MLLLIPRIYKAGSVGRKGRVDKCHAVLQQGPRDVLCLPKSPTNPQAGSRHSKVHFCSGGVASVIIQSMHNLGHENRSGVDNFRARLRRRLGTKPRVSGRREATRPRSGQGQGPRFQARLISTLLCELEITHPSGLPYPFCKVKLKINLPCSLQSGG